MIQHFGNTDTGNLFTCRFESYHLYFFRQSIATFGQVLICHSLILSIHLLRQNVFDYLFKNLPPRESFWITHTMEAITVLIENVLIPIYWFTSAWLSFDDLWSTRNTVFNKSNRIDKFQMIGNWKPQNSLNLYSKDGKIYLYVLF